MITESEFEQEKASGRSDQPILSAQIDAPTIAVEQPDETKPIKSPASIRISFQPHGTSAIELSSLRILYGFFGIEITSRILEHAKLTPSGLSATNAQVPSGHHRVTFEIADSLHRVGRRSIEFTVV
jgi:hypothetical protein